MLVNVIKIGNSRGIIIPSSFLKKLNSDKLVLEENESGLSIRAAKPVRDGWEEAARLMHHKDDDELMMDFPNEFDDEEWTW
jgi:antitoxin MazE